MATARFAEHLFETFYSRLSAYVRLRAPVQDAEDLVSDIFLKALAAQDALRGEPGPWLFTIARHRIAEYYRDKGTEMNAEARIERPAPAPGLGALEKLEAEEFRARMRRAMRHLSDTERDIIALKFSDGLSNAQIADMLGISANHLGVVLHRALKQLKDAMQLD